MEFIIQVKETHIRAAAEEITAHGAKFICGASCPVALAIRDSVDCSPYIHTDSIELNQIKIGDAERFGNIKISAPESVSVFVAEFDEAIECHDADQDDILNYVEDFEFNLEFEMPE